MSKSEQFSTISDTYSVTVKTITEMMSVKDNEAVIYWDQGIAEAMAAV
jgi:hypothetical protein